MAERGRRPVVALMVSVVLSSCGRPMMPEQILPGRDGGRDVGDVFVCMEDVVFDAAGAGEYRDAERRPGACLSCDAGSCTPAAAGCAATENCGDGLDNDCDGV